MVAKFHKMKKLASRQRNHPLAHTLASHDILQRPQPSPQGLASFAGDDDGCDTDVQLPPLTLFPSLPEHLSEGEEYEPKFKTRRTEFTMCTVFWEGPLNDGMRPKEMNLDWSFRFHLAPFHPTSRTFYSFDGDLRRRLPPFFLLSIHQQPAALFDEKRTCRDQAGYDPVNLADKECTRGFGSTEASPIEYRQQRPGIRYFAVIPAPTSVSACSARPTKTLRLPADFGVSPTGDVSPSTQPQNTHPYKPTALQTIVPSIWHEREEQGVGATPAVEDWFGRDGGVGGSVHLRVSMKRRVSGEEAPIMAEDEEEDEEAAVAAIVDQEETSSMTYTDLADAEEHFGPYYLSLLPLQQPPRSLSMLQREEFLILVQDGSVNPAGQCRWVDTLTASGTSNSVITSLKSMEAFVSRSTARKATMSTAWGRDVPRARRWR
ncbi:hypothetical protein M407DRAFT_11873 [Tulasnella calospora MUT 4182]|uniref:Uncharacterized protein n=1 Tax=Tulasnella calospora MUT 4182 TaxID=1051891 RepID=A0A0C3LAH0_9AGAM|nr:hypothetical protein M407DRAFT_11873 [Tulasnella calospora MUT 4182]